MATENNAVDLLEGEERPSSDSKRPMTSNVKHASKLDDVASATRQDSSRTFVKGLKGRKRLRLGDALREAGLDEHKLAEMYVDVVEKLRNKTDDGGSVEKVLANVLKECSRFLEAPRPTTLCGLGDSPTRILLVHKVPRPERNSQNNRGLSRLIETNTHVLTGVSVDSRAATSPIAKSSEEPQ